MDPIAPPRWRSATNIALLVIGLFTIALLPIEQQQLAGQPTFITAVVVVVACFDLLTAGMLVGQFRATGDRRILAMSWAYVFSLIVLVAYSLAFPGIFGDSPPLMTWTSVAPYLWVVWHAGFPFLLGLAWAPFIKRWNIACPPAQRRRTAAASLAICVVSALAVPVFICSAATILPSVISGTDTSAMTRICGPWMAVFAGLGVFWCARGLRHHSGAERWALVACVAVVADVVLTLTSGTRYSVGWYGGRFLTVMSAIVVFWAMLKEFQRIERKLHTETAKLQGLLRHAKAVVFVQDLAGRYSLVNPGFEDAVGMRSAQVLGRTPEELWGSHRQSDMTVSLDDVINTDALEDEATIMLADGSERTYLATRFAIRDGQGEPLAMAGIATDLTSVLEAREQAEKAVALARDQAIEASRMKSDFLAKMSHEIRTPMNGVIGLTDLLLDSGLTPEQRTQASGIQTAGSALLAVINDILDYSKIESGRIDLEQSDFNLLDTVDAVASLVSQSARAKNLRLTSAVDSDLPKYVNGDSVRIRQILLNLALNAVKFTETGSVTIRALRSELPAGGSGLRFEVADTGIGIDPREAGRLFEPFTQADSSTTRRFGGTGLGLAISLQLTEAMHGTITVDSQIGVGSIFICTLPLVVAEPSIAADPGTPAVAPVTSASPGTKGHLLIVEDNEINQMVALGMVRKLGYTADVASNGLEALQILQDSSAGYFAILMDSQMPTMDGLTATRAIRSLAAWRSVPIIGVSASVLREDREACLDAGMNAYITKPLSATELRAELDAAIPSGPAAASGGSVPAQREHTATAPRDAVGLATAIDSRFTDLFEDFPDAHLWRERMVEAFVSKAPALLETITAAAEELDAAGLESAAHGLKGMAGNIGADALAGLASELEEMGRRADFTDAPAMIIAIRAEVGHVCVALETVATAG